MEPDKILSMCTRFAALMERELFIESKIRRLLVLEMQERYRSRYPNDQIFSLNESTEILAARCYWSLPADSLAKLQEKTVLGPALESDSKEITAFVKDPKGQLQEAHFFPVPHERGVAGFVVIVASSRTDKVRKHQSWRAVYGFDDILGGTVLLRKCVDDAKSYASNDLPVLITGESGTGKELFAHAIHSASHRSHGPFVAINCAAVPDELLAADLFGYSEGAFTGAARGGKIGKLEIAHRGSIFLDEIESMSAFMQASLLRVLEEGYFAKLGALERQPLDVRFIAATNVDLVAKARAQEFRTDLYYRLASLTIMLPPLRERREDILILIDRMSCLYSCNFTQQAITRLQRFCWPGNVRQLRNIFQRTAVRTHKDWIEEDDLDDEVCPSTCAIERCPFTQKKGLSTSSLLSSIPKGGGSQKDEIVKALETCNGNITAAARILNLHRVTLSKKLQRMDIRKLYS